MPFISDRKEQNEVLRAFRRASSQKRHNLKAIPEILWQQMYSRL